MNYNMDRVLLGAIGGGDVCHTTLHNLMHETSLSLISRRMHQRVCVCVHTWCFFFLSFLFLFQTPYQ